MNTFLFLVSAVYLAISSKLIAKYGTIEGSQNKYSFKGYQIGLWAVTVISYGLGGIVSFFIPEKKFVRLVENEPQQPIQQDHLLSVDESINNRLLDN